MNNTQKISCDQNFVQSCSKTCTPKLKYFGITDSMILSTELDSNGNIKTLNIDPCYPNPPSLTVKDSLPMYYSHIDGEYVNFDSTLYDNIYVKAYKDNISGDSSSYSISIEPLDCSKRATISNITLYKPSDYYINNVSNDGEHIELSTPVSQSISNLMNKCIKKLFLSLNTSPIIQEAKEVCSKSLFFNYSKDQIDLIGADNSGYFVQYIKVNSDNKPSLSISNGKLQYLNSSGEYKNFDSYDNVKLNLFPLDSVFSGSSISSDLIVDYILRIYPEDSSKPMILADKAIFPFQNYEIKDILDDGTIDSMYIQNSFTSLLN